MIATEYIYTASSAQDLAQKFANTLASMLGWAAYTESTGASVKREGLALYFKFNVSSTSVQLQIRNNAAVLSSDRYGVTYNTNNLYGITAFVSAGGTIAVGIRDGAKARQTITPKSLNVAIAQTQSGEYVGIMPEPSGNFNGICYMLAESGTAYKDYRHTHYNSERTFNSAETVIRQMPYLWGGTMFKDLYEMVVMSSFAPANCTRLFANGTYYRVFGRNSSYYGVAIADIT